MLLPFLAAAPIDLGKSLIVGVGQTANVADVYQTPADLVNTIVPVIFILAGIIFFIMIFYSAFKFFQDGSKGIEEARSIWTTALIGFLLMFVAYWIVQIVEITTGVVIFG